MAHPPRRLSPRRRLAVAIATAAAVSTVPIAPAVAAMQVGPPVDTRTWKGDGRTLIAGDTVKVAGKSFNRFLARTFADLDSAPIGEVTCTAVGTVVLKRWRSDGYAAMTTRSACAGTATRVIAVRQDGRWSIPQALEGRTPGCADLSSYSVPPRLRRSSCAVPSGTVVTYRDWYWNKVDDRGNPR